MIMRSYISVIAGLLCLPVAIFAQGERVLPVAQEMPVLKDCREISNFSERRACSEGKISELLKEHLEYPEEAKKAGIEGTVVVQFTVDEKGKTLDYTTLEDPGSGLGAAAIAAVQKFGRWEPGKNRGEAVKVRMSVPVRFEISAQDNQEAPVPEPEVYVVADQMPTYPGCDFADKDSAQTCTFEKLMHYMRSNLVYPEEARKAGAEGTVVVKFVVDTEGVVTNARVEESVHEACDKEAMRLVKSMPAWVPGTHNGKKVKVELALPFKFAISEKE